MRPCKNYIDEKGNYHNIENLSLAQIFDSGVEQGYKIAKFEQEREKHNDRSRSIGCPSGEQTR